MYFSDLRCWNGERMLSVCYICKKPVMLFDRTHCSSCNGLWSMKQYVPSVLNIFLQILNKIKNCFRNINMKYLRCFRTCVYMLFIKCRNAVLVLCYTTLANLCRTREATCVKRKVVANSRNCHTSWAIVTSWYYFNPTERLWRDLMWPELGLHGECPIFLTDFNKTWNFSTDCHKKNPVSNFTEIHPNKGLFYTYACVTHSHYNTALHTYLNFCMYTHCKVSRCTNCVHCLATVLATGTCPEASGKISLVRIRIYYFLRSFLILSKMLHCVHLSFPHVYYISRPSYPLILKTLQFFPLLLL
jgi:hypothetical protein